MESQKIHGSQTTNQRLRFGMQYILGRSHHPFEVLKTAADDFIQRTTPAKDMALVLGRNEIDPVHRVHRKEQFLKGPGMQTFRLPKYGGKPQKKPMLDTGWGPQDSVQLPYKWLNSMVYDSYSEWGF